MEVFRQHGLDEDVVGQAAAPEEFGKLRWLTSIAGDGALDAQLIHELDAFGGGALRDRYAAAGPILPGKLPQVRLERSCAVTPNSAIPDASYSATN